MYVSWSFFAFGVPVQDQDEEVTLRILSIQFRQVLDELERLRAVMVEFDSAITLLDDRLSLLESVHGRLSGRIVD